MRRTLQVLAVLLAAGPLAGCSDSPDMYFHDVCSFHNEMADVMFSINDEAAAEDANSYWPKLFKEKEEQFKDRMEKLKQRYLEKPNKQDRLEWNGAWYDYYDEALATGKRLEHARQRLDALIGAIQANDGSASVKSLTAVRGWKTSVVMPDIIAEKKATPK
jgi:hypothetical protein